MREAQLRTYFGDLSFWYYQRSGSFFPAERNSLLDRCMDLLDRYIDTTKAIDLSRGDYKRQEVASTLAGATAITINLLTFAAPVLLCRLLNAIPDPAKLKKA